MISFDELSEKSKSQIRTNQILSEAFEFYFFQRFNRKPSFCCSFSDYEKLFNNFKKKTEMKTNKYKIDYPPTAVLAFRKNGRTYRTMVKNATDEFLDDFLKNYAEAHHPNAKSRITLIEKPKAKKPAKKKVATPKIEKDEPATKK